MKEHAILFVNWIHENCIASYNGKYFFNDLINGSVENEYSVEEVYDLFIIELNLAKP